VKLPVDQFLLPGIFNVANDSILTSTFEKLWLSVYYPDKNGCG
jgi:hypothetical protein